MWHAHCRCVTHRVIIRILPPRCELGTASQVSRGTLFPMRAKKLYEIYKNLESIEEIPLPERQKLEQQVFACFECFVDVNTVD